MAGKKKKVQKLNKKRMSINIGVVVFLFILVAVVAGVINNISKNQLQIYEVQSVGLAQDNVVTGLIIREEEVITASNSGYLNYYSKDGVRIVKDSLLVSLDETKEIYDQIINVNMSEELTDYDRQYINNIISSYRDNSSLEDYSINIAFSEEISNVISELSGAHAGEKVDELKLTSIPKTFHTYHAKYAGLVSYNADELSGIKVEDVTSDIFNLSEDYKIYNRRKTLAAEGDPVVKIITSDHWQIICPLNESQDKALTGLKSLPVTICEDGLKVTLPFEKKEIDGQTYAIFTLDNYIQNYLNYRFVSLKLNWQVSQGYKIPLSSITEKTFFIVPKSFFSKGDNTNNLGLTREIIDSKTGVATYDFVECTIYHSDDNYYYIDASDVKKGDRVFSSSGESYEIGLTEKLEGVYNINKGYAIFRRIERITQNSEYCIVKMDTAYGISLYDHIALDASDAVDSGIIY